MIEPEEHEIDITIEAVTGTVYDLCVSPFETILGIKTKIQRLEGIPVHQQHLVYGEIELQDDYCLEEYGIQTGCQLKLVISLRGGPVHAHRIQLEDSALLELAEYLEAQSETDQDPYTFMLLNDGNLELVNTDGGSQFHSPVEISESRLSGSQTSLVAAAVQPKILTLAENMATRDKMRGIQSRLKNLRLNRAEHQMPKNVSRLKRKCTATKVIILDSRASSRIPVSPSPIVTPPQPSSRSCSNPHCCVCTCQHHCPQCHAVSAKTQRKLIFRPPEAKLNVSSDNRVTRKSSVSRERFYQSTAFSNSMEQPPPYFKPNRHRKLKPLSTTVDHTFVTPPLPPEHKTVDHGSTVGSRLFSVNKEMTHLSSSGSHRNNNDGHFLPPINWRATNNTSTLESFKQQQQQQQQQQQVNHLKQTSLKKNRCMQCGKKTRIAATYTCRCGGLYCSSHRYAETHSCTFDYKSEGKETIARNNPLVVAPKLPKI